jgi:hypothetical protein
VGVLEEPWFFPLWPTRFNRSALRGFGPAMQPLAVAEIQMAPQAVRNGLFFIVFSILLFSVSDRQTLLMRCDIIIGRHCFRIGRYFRLRRRRHIAVE